MDVLCENGFSIIRALPPFSWPGTASVTAISVWITRCAYAGQRIRGEVPVVRLNASLEESDIDDADAVQSLELFGVHAYLGVKANPGNRPVTKEKV